MANGRFQIAATLLRKEFFTAKEREEPSAAAPQPISEYLSQRRKGREEKTK
jgi:hypothetical protein